MPKKPLSALVSVRPTFTSTNLAALAELTGACTIHAYIQFEQHKLALITLHVHTHLIIAARPPPSTRAGGLCSPRARYDDSFHASCHARSRRRLSTRTRARALSSLAPNQAKETRGSPRILFLPPPFQPRPFLLGREFHAVKRLMWVQERPRLLPREADVLALEVEERVARWRDVAQVYGMTACLLRGFNARGLWFPSRCGGSDAG